MVRKSGGLSDDERAEYTELGLAYRNDDAIGLAVGALLLPLAFGPLAIAWQAPQLFWPTFIVAAAALVLYATYSARLSMYTAVRLRRMRDLEAKADMTAHRGIAGAIRNRVIDAPSVGELQRTACALWLLAWPVTAVLVAAHQLPLTHP